MVAATCAIKACSLEVTGDMSRVSRQRSVRVEPGWLYKGGDQGFSASSERSESANEDILIFFFLLDLATRVQV
ncbi:hypothetical protein GBA52_012093 [Prunus armeniaca]|nr:hypothetical protein GBA52_012093 [Prunus armeniaca]